MLSSQNILFSTTGLFLEIILLLLTFFILNFYWKRRKLYRLAKQFPEPPSWPIIGHSLYFIGANNDTYLEKIYKLFEYSRKDVPLKIWLGPELLISFTDPAQVEKVMTSQKFSHKSKRIYRILKMYLGDGLITISGEKFKQHKKIIQPLFSMKFCETNFHKFNKYINFYLERLESDCKNSKNNSVTLDISHLSHNVFSDIVLDTFFGADLQKYQQEKEDFVDAFSKIYDLGFYRIVRPLFHNDFLYSFSKFKSQQDQCIEHLQKYTRLTLEDCKNRNYKDLEGLSIAENVILYLKENPEAMNEDELVGNLITLFAASEDTLTTATSFVLVCLGLYPEYQDKLVQEINTVLKNEVPTIDKLNELKYLDMCLRETLRLVPTGAYIVRDAICDSQIDKWTIPKGASIVVPIYNLHRDKDIWEKPYDFHPDHFLPEVADKRNPYSYLPFSAGPRGCIGKIIANFGFKLFMVNFLRKFKVSTEGTMSQVQFKLDISVRKKDGYVITVQPRN